MAVVFFVDMSPFRHACAKAFTVSRVCLFSSVIEMFVTSTVATNKCWLGRLGIVFPKFIANSNSIKPIPSPLYNVCVQSSPIQSNLTFSIYLASYLCFFFNHVGGMGLHCKLYQVTVYANSIGGFRAAGSTWLECTDPPWSPPEREGEGARERLHFNILATLW